MAERGECNLYLLRNSTPDTNYRTLQSESAIVSPEINLEIYEPEADYMDHPLDRGGAEKNVPEPGNLLRVSSQYLGSPPSSQVPDQVKASSLDELIFRLKFSHLTPGVEWFEEITATSRATNDQAVYERILHYLSEYPLPIREKMRLYGQIRATLDADTVAGSKTSVAANGDLRNRKEVTSKKERSHLWNYRLSIPINLWEDTIGRVAAYFGSHVASYFRFLRFLALLNGAVALIMFLFISLPQIVPGEVWSDDIQSGFFGELSNTIFFYGAYSNSSSIIEAIKLHYNRPLSYFMTWCSVNILMILVIVISMYASYRKIKTAGDSGEVTFSSHVFTSWDHSVTTRKGSKIRSNAITTMLKEMTRDEKTKRPLTPNEKMVLLFYRITFNLLSIAVLAASAYLIYVVAEESITPGLDIPQVVGDFLKKYRLTLLVMGLKVLIPPLLTLPLTLERYHPRTQIKMQIARTAVFYVASLVVFLVSIYHMSTRCMSSSNTEKQDQTAYCCWENEVGEQLFQVIILDLAMEIVIGVVISGGRAIIVKFWKRIKLDHQNFNVAGLILDLVYGQSLIWLGLFFAPFFALVGLVKLAILFYFNYGLARACFVPSDKVFRASRSGTFYLFVLLVTLMVCLFPMAYAIIEIETSKSCGPFKDNTYVYKVLTDRIGDSPKWLQDILHYVTAPAVVIPVIVVLIFVLIYYRVKSTLHKTEAKDLRRALQFERKVEKRRVLATAKLQQGVSVASGLNLDGY